MATIPRPYKRGTPPQLPGSDRRYLDDELRRLEQSSALVGEALAEYAPLASPAFTGDPTAPTPAAADNDTSIATTAFVQTELADYAPLASPTFTGDPKAPTPAAADNDTSIATTAFVQTELASYAPLASPTFTGTVSAAAVTLSGLLTVNGGQIAFPASQSASADANTLDDYEEGTFTPTLLFGGGNTGMTYTVQRGRYTKIGRSVNFDLHITVNAVGSSTGNVSFGGLPFTSAATYYVVCSCYTTGLAAAGTVDFAPYIAPGGTVIDCAYVAAGNAAILIDTNIQTGSEFIISGTYTV